MHQHECRPRPKPLAAHNAAVAAGRAPVEPVVADMMEDRIIDAAAVAVAPVARQPVVDARARAVASSTRSGSARWWGPRGPSGSP